MRWVNLAVWTRIPYLEEAGAHHHIQVSTEGQQRGRRTRAERAELNHVDVVLTRHCVAGTAGQVLLHVGIRQRWLQVRDLLETQQ